MYQVYLDLKLIIVNYIVYVVNATLAVLKSEIIGISMSAHKTITNMEPPQY